MKPSQALNAQGELVTKDFLHQELMLIRWSLGLIVAGIITLIMKAFIA